MSTPSNGRRLALGILCTTLVALPGLALAQEEASPKPPFITTPQNVAEQMLVLAGTRPDDVVVDLGSGDGRIVIAAAKRFGARGIGLELDPALVERSRASARSAGVADRTDFRVADVLKADFRNATVVTAYLLPWLLEKLGTTLLYDLRPGTRIVTHAFRLAGWQPDRTESVIVMAPDPKAGAETTLYMWTVPGKVRGNWIGEPGSSGGNGGSLALQIQQNFQELDVAGTTREGVRFTATGRMDGMNMMFSGGSSNRRVAFNGRLDQDLISGILSTDQGALQTVTLKRR